MLSNGVSENCLNCAIGIALKLGAIFGLPFFTIKCKHDVPNLKSTIIYSRYFLLSGLVTLSVFVYSMAMVVIRFKSLVFSLDHIFDYLVTIPHFILYLCSAITILYGIIRVKIIEKAYTSFQLTMENWRVVTSKVLLPTQDIAYLRFRTFLYTVGITSLFVISAVGLFIFDTKSKMSGAQKFGRLMTLYVIGVVMFILTVIDDYFKLVCKKFHNYLKADLESKFNFAVDELLIRNHTLHTEKLILTRKNLVSTYTQLHGRLIYSFQYMNQFLNPLVLVWVLGFTISLTVNGYLVLTAFLDSYKNVFKATMMTIEFEVACSFALILFTAIRNSELRAVVSTPKPVGRKN